MHIHQQTLCFNCLFDEDCVLQKSSQHILQCEEHAIQASEIAPPIIRIAPEPIENHIAGLCNWCLHKNSCKLIQANSIIFNCEHYE